MRPILATILLICCAFSCTTKKQHDINPETRFTAELEELQTYFKIPGLAVSITKNKETIYQNYLGAANLELGATLDSTYVFPIASVTKVFSGVLLMKLVEQKILSLETPINTFFDEPVLADSILVKHVLSHTSQGNVGKTFYYSSRFGMLTQVVEKVTNKPFEKVMYEEIIAPLQLKNTFLLKDEDQLETEHRKLANPYILDNGIENGFIDFGYSTSAGIVSNLEDLTIFNEALDNNMLMSKKMKEVMFTANKSKLPYGYGIFHQQTDEINMVWAYGQYDCYSSLFFKLPDEDITLILLANNNLLSDPARLIYGDARSSLFVLSFLKNYSYNQSDMPLFEPEETVYQGDASTTNFYRKKLLAEALAESFMARFDPKKLQSSEALLNKVFTLYPNYLEYADLNLLHNLSFLKDIAFYMELGPFNNFDKQIVQIGNKLLRQDPNNPYVHVYLGTFYSRKENQDKARYHFEQIVNAKNFSKNWYTAEASNWLKAHE